MWQLGSKSERVDVIVLPGQNPNFSFRSPIWVNDELVFDNQGYDGFYVSFHLKDSDPQYYFAADMNVAVSAKILGGPEDRCPDQNPPGTKPWSKFKPKELSPDLRILTVRNPNTEKYKFGFSLFVTTSDDGSPDPSGRYLKLDPIGDNRNGAVRLNWLAVVTTVVAVAAVAALAAYELGLF